MITKKYPSPSGLTIIVLLTAATASAGQLFTTTLSGSQEVPPNASPATGSGTVLLDDARTTITVNLTFAGLSAPATAAHIHGPANPGTNAPVLITFTGFPAATNGAYSSTPFAITPTQVSQLVTGQLYMGIHDSTFPGGEIRGQLLADGHSDFDGDGRSDILWRNSSSGVNYIYLMNGFMVASQGVINTVTDPNWTIVGTGDFNGDGRADILWRNTSTGEDYMYLMIGRLIGGAGYMGYPVGTDWKIVGIGDFDGDSRSDVLWRNSSTGENYLWLMNGMTITASGYLPTLSDLNWKVVGVADFDGDGRADILWRYMGAGPNSGINYIWLMNGFSIVSQGTVNTITDMNWKVVGTADFDGDGRADILWRNGSTGENYMYLMVGKSIASAGYVNIISDLNWKIVAVGDYDGDTKADILWRNSATGDDFMYLMNGMSIVSSGYVGSAQDPTWNIVP